jgi:signal transduction histidine kinase/DNA-binding response OmpR family regulator
VTRGQDDILRVFTPELPDVSGAGAGSDVLADALFLDNCAERLTTLSSDSTTTRLSALDAVTMSIDGLTYRLTLRKGLYFHCGAELTAADAVETILRVLKRKDSASQLHRVVAKDGARFAVQAVSRYRFEVHLTRRLPDLMLRLALPELSLRHEGRACFSGLWKVAGKDESGLLLAVHDKHPDAGQCAYAKVRWQRLVATPELGPHAAEGAYLYLYPGTMWKSPPEELLTDELCRAMDGSLSFLWKVTAPPDQRSELRMRLVAAARSCFGKSSLWRRAPLTALAPKTHVLHAPFPAEPGVATSRRLGVALIGTDPSIPRQIWEQFRQVAAEELKLDIDLVDSREAAGGRPTAVLRRVFCAHPADYCTPLSPFAGDAEVSFGKESEFCRDLTRQHHHAPFLSVPLMLRSNRTLRRQDATGLVLFADVRPSSDRLRGRRMQDAALKALGAGLQMFVHDVKRPFSMVQGVLGLLEAAPSEARVAEITAKYLPEVRRATDAAGRLIQDILEIGSDAEPNCEDVSTFGLLDSVLHEIFALRPLASVALEYRLQHTRKLFVDPQKVSRAVSNIILNALEAMGPGGGTITFETVEEAGDSMATLSIANTGSFIAPERLTSLFDQFFTEGKKHGTGLGLAIVKKIVVDHGGDVWCESTKEEGVRFRMRLPLATAADQPVTLPRHTAAFAAEAEGGRRAAGAVAPSDLAQLARSGGARILLVDDNPLYLEATQELLTSEERAAASLSFTTASDAKAALTLAARERFDIAIVDVDLGVSGENGLELVRRLRALPPRPDDPPLKVCVHSNGPPFELQRRALEAGADLFLPKPMTLDHLMRLLASPTLRRAASAMPRIAVVDDDALALETWEVQPGYQWLAYDSPAEILAACDADPALLPSLYCVVTDYNFAGSEANGLTLAVELVARHPGLAVFLATDRPMQQGEVQTGVRAVISKDAAKGLAALRGVLEE